jgi:hypothetical protein
MAWMFKRNTPQLSALVRRHHFTSLSLNVVGK